MLRLAVRTLLAGLLLGSAMHAVAQQSALCAPPTRPGPPGHRLKNYALASSPLPLADYRDVISECSWAKIPPPYIEAAKAQAPPSEWLNSEHEVYAHALEREKVDVLVLPMQTQGFGLDRIERAVMSAEVAYAIGSRGTLKVADPFLVARTLGEGARRLPAEAVHQLAESTQARYVVTSFVGHDGNHHFTLTLQVSQRPPAIGPIARSAPWQHDWRSVTFTDEETPAVVLHRMLPDILRMLPLPQPLTAERSTGVSWPTSLRFGGSLREIARPDTTAAPAEVAFVLLGALAPARQELARERFFERAWLAALSQVDDSPSARFFDAYTLLQLGRRPGALKRLIDQSSSESLALRLLLNGDLPDAEAAVLKLPGSFERLLLQLSVRDLESAYERKLRTVPAVSAKVLSKTTEWRALVQVRADGANVWNVLDPRVGKLLLDRNFPVAEFSMESVLRGARATGADQPDAVTWDLATARHARRVAESLANPACCTPAQLRPNEWDVLWLLEALGMQHMDDSLRTMTELQGRANASLDAIHRYDPLLAGNPQLEVARADALNALADSGPPDERKTRNDAAARSALIVAQAFPGQSDLTLRAMRNLGLPSEYSTVLFEAYSYDYPRRAAWPTEATWAAGVEPVQYRQQAQRFIAEALQFSASDMSPVFAVLPGAQPGQTNVDLQDLGTRFLGNPARQSKYLPRSVLSDASSGVTASIQRAIDQDPELWDNYEQLGRHILESGGSYDAARAAFLKYPGFHDPHPQDPVALSGQALDTGGYFDALGLRESATVFYRISANLHTGSWAEMAAAQRLLVFDGEFTAAARSAMERAQQYKDVFAYHDWLSLLYVMGDKKRAWDAFAQLKTSFDHPQIWAAALVGQRREGMTDGQLRQWLLGDDIRPAHFDTRNFATLHALWAYSTDRMPPSDLGTLIETLDGPPLAHVDGDITLTDAPHPMFPSSRTLIRASRFRDGKRRVHIGESLKSQLAYFADAYATLRHRDYGAAVARFDAMGDHYPIEQYALAYFAYAASKTGDQEHLESYLDQLAPQASFDYYLARAFFAAGHKDAEAAHRQLVLALRHRPATDRRPVFTDYQYAEACEWLYQDTGDVRFRQDLLDWLHSAELMAPVEAWAYAMHYSYLKPGAQRTQALAMTLYLDRNSPRIAHASADERHAAEEWLAQNNPFLRPNGKSKSHGSLLPTVYRLDTTPLH